MLFLLVGITVSSATFLNSWAIHEEFTPTEEVPPIPSWIKTTVGWWADDKVTDIEFLEGITYLIDNDFELYQSYKLDRSKMALFVGFYASTEKEITSKIDVILTENKHECNLRPIILGVFESRSI